MGHEGVTAAADGHEPNVLGGNDDVVHLRDNAVNHGVAADGLARLSPHTS